MTKPGRIPCSVPFCRRTAKDESVDGQEILCRKHFRAVPRELRGDYVRLRRAVEAAMDVPPEAYSSARREAILADYRRLEEMWLEIKRQAIEAAVGIA